MILENSLFDKYAELIFQIPGNEPLILNYKDIDFDAVIVLNSTLYSNKATVNIYNLPIKIEEKFKKLEKSKTISIEIIAGYNSKNKTEYGTIFKGFLGSIKTTKLQTTIKTEMAFTDSHIALSDKKILVSFEKKDNITASMIIKKIIEKTNEFIVNEKRSSSIPLNLEEPIRLGKDITYLRGKYFNTDLKSILNKICKDTESIYYIDNNTLIFRPLIEPEISEIECDIARVIDIKADSIPNTITMFFDHRIREGHSFNIKFAGNRYLSPIDSTTNNSIITKVTHSINFLSNNHTTQVEFSRKPAISAPISEPQEEVIIIVEP